MPEMILISYFLIGAILFCYDYGEHKEEIYYLVMSLGKIKAGLFLILFLIAWPWGLGAIWLIWFYKK